MAALSLQENIQTWLLRAGTLIRAMRAESFAAENKDDNTPVTAIDKAVEQFLRDCIMQAYPDDGIIGEEFPPHLPEAPRQWYIDPIDGTRALLGGFPTFTTLIGLTENNHPALGVIFQPVTGDLWIGDRKAASRNNQPCHSRKEIIRIEDALFSTTSPYLFSDHEKPYIEILIQKSCICQFGGDAYAYGLLASGTVDLIVESGLDNHDFMALIPVIEGAGGVITDWQGQPLSPQSDGTVCAAGNSALHRQALEILNP